jgi:putative transposase
VITRERQPLNRPQKINETWTLGFIRDTLYDGRSFRSLNVIDEGNRETLRIKVGRSIPATRVVRIMDESIEVYGKPKYMRLDNRPEQTAEAFADWANKTPIYLAVYPAGQTQSASFYRTVQQKF